MIKISLERGWEMCKREGIDMKEGMEKLAKEGWFIGVSKFACFDDEGHLFLDMDPTGGDW